MLPEHLTRDLDALVQREQRRLLRVHQNRHDNPVEQPRAARDDVDVPVRQRIERSRIHGQRRHYAVYNASALSPDVTSRDRCSPPTHAGGGRRRACSTTSTPPGARRSAAAPRTPSTCSSYGGSKIMMSNDAGWRSSSARPTLARIIT